MKSIDAKLFPSWEGLGVGLFPRFHEDKGREISVNISRITDLPTPYIPSQEGTFYLRVVNYIISRKDDQEFHMKIPMWNAEKLSMRGH